MGHEHSVYDTDPHFVIDKDTRTITLGSKSKTVIMQGDHNSTIVSFDMPAIIDGHEMILCDDVKIHYTNIAGSERVEDIYGVTDLDYIDDVDKETLAFTWKITNNATRLVGALNFSVKFRCTTVDPDTQEVIVDYEWNTAICTALSVSSSLSNSDAIVPDDPDALDALRADIVQDVLKSLPNGDEVKY